MRNRYYTPEEANAVLGEVKEKVLSMRSALRELRGLAAVLRDPREESDDPMRRKGKKRMLSLQKTINGLFDDMTQMGIEIKDLEHGLVDFPALKAGQEVLLCWRLGEESVRYWHTLADGYRGRRSLDDIPDEVWLWSN